MDKDIGLYVHIPFCIKKCNYCDFRSYEGKLCLRDEYIEAVCKELDSYRDELKKRRVSTIYIGGGTPSMLTPNQLMRLGGAIRDVCDIAQDYEFTIEVNPQSGIDAFFKAAKAIGANRISMGLQSADDSQLKTLGRSHTLSDFDRCFSSARNAGFDNISVDIMTCLPSQSMESLISSADYIISKAPEHISAYALKIEEGTPFYDMCDSLDLPDEDLQSEMYIKLSDHLDEHGYHRYEISNYAKSGFESRHNTRYWLCGEYIGIGSAAHSYLSGRRYENEPIIEDYIKRIKDGTSAVCESYELDDNDILEEYIMLGLRLAKGICFSDFYKRFGFDFKERFKKRYDPYVKSGHMLENDISLCFSSEGFLLSNHIISDILLEI